ncbi:MAG: hypothetical protein LBH85_08445 [Treponema sp.]|jgi:hypothetical protein|nr:hypothetical protein [Treponema sp.]
MARRIFVFLIPVFLSCASPPPGNVLSVSGGGFWDPDRFQGRIVFFGVSGGYYVSRNRAIRMALLDAARRLSFYRSVEAFVQFDETYNNQFQGVQIDEVGTLFYDDEYEKYIDALEFDPERDILEENNILFIRAGYKGGDSIRVNHVRPPTDGAKKPAWIENPPARIDGYPAAVGFAGPRFSYKNAVTASYENAVFNMVLNHFFTVIAEHAEHSQTIYDFSGIRSAGTVKGFYILETWTDSVTGGVWTLAIAQEIKNSFAVGE